MVADPSDIAKNTRRIMQRYEIPGIALALIENWECTHITSMGVTSFEKPTPITPHTLFDVCSLGKPSVAYSCLRLADQGILPLDVPIVDSVKEKVLAEGTNAQLVTPRMALCHTSGISHDGQSIHYRPGTAWHYSTGGYRCLQKCLSVLIGKPFHQVMQDSVLAPLGLQNATFDHDIPIAMKFAMGHDADRNCVPFHRNLDHNLLCSVVDYAKFVTAGIGSALSRNNPPWVSEMLSSQVEVHKDLAWGLGWGLQESNHGRTMWHWGGGKYMPHNSFVICSEEGHGVVLMLNAANVDEAISEILYQVVGFNMQILPWDTDIWWNSVPQRQMVDQADELHQPCLDYLSNELSKTFGTNIKVELTNTGVGSYTRRFTEWAETLAKWQPPFVAIRIELAPGGPASIILPTPMVFALGNAKPDGRELDLDVLRTCSARIVRSLSESWKSLGVHIRSDKEEVFPSIAPINGEPEVFCNMSIRISGTNLEENEAKIYLCYPFRTIDQTIVSYN